MQLGRPDSPDLRSAGTTYGPRVSEGKLVMSGDVFADELSYEAFIWGQLPSEAAGVELAPADGSRTAADVTDADALGIRLFLASFSRPVGDVTISVTDDRGRELESHQAAIPDVGHVPGAASAVSFFIGSLTAES